VHAIDADEKPALDLTPTAVTIIVALGESSAN
jgi:hypothetical protein